MKIIQKLNVAKLKLKLSLTTQWKHSKKLTFRETETHHDQKTKQKLLYTEYHRGARLPELLGRVSRVERERFRDSEREKTVFEIAVLKKGLIEFVDIATDVLC